jgi:hypothetical protein
LPLLTVPAGTKLFRVHQAVHDAIFFGPAVTRRQAFSSRQPAASTA